MIDIGPQIQVVRRARGMSGRALANMINATPTYITMLERGTRTPSLALLQRLAAALGIPAWALVLLAEEREPLVHLSEDMGRRLNRAL